MPVFAALGLLFALLAWGRHHFGHLFRMWRALQIPANNLPFADTRTITYSIDCLLSGSNPYFDRSFDPWHRLYNYPPVWLDLRYLGVHSTTTDLLGSLFVLSALAACIALFRVRGWLTGVLVFFAMLCWPLLFAIERGNTDLLIFALLVFGALLSERFSSRWMVFIRQGVILALTVLKIFPVAATAALIRNRKAILTALITAVISVAALVVTCGHDLRYVLANTPEVTLQSFGVVPLLEALKGIPPSMQPVARSHSVWATPLAVLAGSVALAIGAWRRSAISRLLPGQDLETGRGFLAVSGLAIYCLTFSRGSSFDYRLIFLLLPLMALIECLNRRQSRGALPAAIVLLAFLWSPYADSSLLQELLDAVVFVGACLWLGSTLMNHLQVRNQAQAKLL